MKIGQQLCKLQKEEPDTSDFANLEKKIKSLDGEGVSWGGGGGGGLEVGLNKHLADLMDHL